MLRALRVSIFSVALTVIRLSDTSKGHADLSKGGPRIWADGAQEEGRPPVVRAILHDGVEERW